MSWRDRYNKGSFRGVEFFTERSNAQVGQRRAVYEIPLDSKGVASIPLGRRPRRFMINACLLGADHDTDAKKLIEAIEEADPGLLIHPYFGTFGAVMVVPGDSINITQDTKTGGKTEVAFEATESRAKAPTPAARPDKRTAVTTKTAALRVANKEAFESGFTIKGVQDFVQSANLHQLDVVIEDLRKINGAISAVLSIPGQAASQIDSVSMEVAHLLDTPGDLYDSITGAIETVYGAITRVAGRFGADTAPNGITATPSAAALATRSLLLAIPSAGLGAGAPAPGQRDTPARERERANAAAIANASKVAALAAIVDAASELELESKRDAELARDSLLDQIDEVSTREELSASVFDALEDVRAAVRERLSSQGLATITTYTPVETTDSLLLAYQLYGDSDRADEIVSRNHVARPHALSAFVPLEVLSK